MNLLSPSTLLFDFSQLTTEVAITFQANSDKARLWTARLYYFSKFYDSASGLALFRLPEDRPDAALFKRQIVADGFTVAAPPGPR